jgi:AraC-like DNA-binding protein
MLAGETSKNTYGRYSVDLGNSLALFTVLDTSSRGRVQLLSMGYDAILSVSGKSEWSFFKKNIEHKQGDLLFIPPGVYYHLIGGEENSIAVHLRFVEKTKINKSYKNSKLGVYSVDCDELKANFLNFSQEVVSETVAHHNKKTVSQKTIDEVFSFYNQLTKYLHSDEECIIGLETVPDNSQLETITSFYNSIDNQDDVSVLELSEGLGYSSSYLARVFKKNFGITPRQYLNVYKINKSLKAIKGNAVNLSTVSADMGFSDQSHFTNVFKRFLRITPGDLLKGTALLL